jgi:hypothetical protein
MKLSTFLPNLHHAYARTDGTYDFPNSREGDMLKTAKTEIEYHLAGLEKLRREIHKAEADHRHASYGNRDMVASAVTQKMYESRHSSLMSKRVAAERLGERLDALRQAFALVTGTAVNGAQFNDLLSERPLDQHEPCQQ